MVQYVSLFLNHAGDVFGRDWLEAETDSVAVARALTIYRNGVGKGFELWRDGRLIHAHVHKEIEKT
jgi:hypothetical protein